MTYAEYDTTMSAEAQPRDRAGGTKSNTRATGLRFMHI